MGCAPSKPGGKTVVITSRPIDKKDTSRSLHNGGRTDHLQSPEPITAEQTNRVDKKRPLSSKENVDPLNVQRHRSVNGRGLAADKPPLPASKAIAFDISLDSNGNKIALDTQKIPTHIKTKLAPLENAPRLTADMLAERQKQVEQNRIRELEKKKEVSRQSSRLRTKILQAREFDQMQYREREATSIEEKQLSAGKNREARLAAQAERKRLREERAKRVKARAEQLKKEGQGDLEFELEKDDAFFNDDDNDSWLGDDDNPNSLQTDMAERLFSGSASTGRGASGTERVTSGTERDPSGTERIYSGRESPSKRVNPRGSAERRARMSAGTTDSFDYAFQRPPPMHTKQDTKDDFFDT